VTRPRAILIFAAAYALLVLVNLIHGAVVADSLRLAMPELSAALDDAFVPAALSLRVALAAWLGWLILFRASNIAKWFVVALMALKLRSIGDAWTGLQKGNLNSILWTVGTIFSMIAVVSLFVPRARYWFATKGNSARHEARTFD
jgi:hypothetical protein